MPIKPTKPSFSKSAKMRLLERDMTVVALAKKIGHNRSTVSLVIHERRRTAGVKKAIIEELNLEEFSA